MSTEELVSNVELISAAPDLLAALKDMAAGWRYIRDHHGDLYGVGWDRAEEAAQAAIAKAEGEIISAREPRVCPSGPPGTDGYDKPVATIRSLSDRLETHAGFVENGGCCDHQMTDEPALLREAALAIVTLSEEAAREAAFEHVDWGWDDAPSATALASGASGGNGPNR